MSYARIHTVAFSGVNVVDIEVQVHIANGLPAFNIVGMANKAVNESKERVRASLHALGLALPAKRITVNLSPADMPKTGNHYDLPIAIGVLVTMDALSINMTDGLSFIGELALDGRLVSVAGVLPASMHALEKDMGLVCPATCGAEAAWAGENLDIIAADNLITLVNHFKGTQILKRPEVKTDNTTPNYLDMVDIKGQDNAKRALEIAAAGAHGIALIGPPGAGKSMLAQRLPGILPDLSPQEALEVSTIYSVAGILKDNKLINQRVFRDPHHTSSLVAMAGGGSRSLPGELSLAHRGVLFLDELPEFSRSTLEVLRQPLENGSISISRANAHVTYPARFQLIAAMNPCKCGYITDPELACSRAPRCSEDYLSRISGPLLDRIDITCELQAISPEQYMDNRQGIEKSAIIKERVIKARNFAHKRWKILSKETFFTNAEIPTAHLHDYVQAEDTAMALLKQAATHMKFTARGISRIQKISRTIADLEASEIVQRAHIAEAISYRRSLTHNT